MTYQERLDAALKVVKDHNEALGGQDKPGYIDSNQFFTCIKASGGTSVERLAQFSHEEIIECAYPNGLPTLPGGKQVNPRVLVKSIAAAFRQDAENKKPDEKRPVSAKKADRMTPRELIEAFDPEDYNSGVGSRLAVICEGQAFIVYANARSVDVETTLKLLLEIKQGFPGRQHVEAGGAVKKVYKIGELPENYADENPLYHNRPLRPDGTCDQTGRSWEGVELNIRQLIRVAIDEGELHISHEQAHTTLDVALQPDAFNKLTKRYPRAAIKYSELAKTGSLPTLKIELGGSEGTGPFPDGKRVVWVGPAKILGNVRSGKFQL